MPQHKERRDKMNCMEEQCWGILNCSNCNELHLDLEEAVKESVI